MGAGKIWISLLMSAILLFMLLLVLKPYGITSSSTYYWFFAVYMPLYFSMLGGTKKYLTLLLLTLISWLALFATDMNEFKEFTKLWEQATMMLLVSIGVLCVMTSMLLWYWKLFKNGTSETLSVMVWGITLLMWCVLVYSYEQSKMVEETYSSWFLLGLFMGSYWTLAVEGMKWWGNESKNN